jgi:hypothetical protein
MFGMNFCGSGAELFDAAGDGLLGTVFAAASAAIAAAVAVAVAVSVAVVIGAADAVGAGGTEAPAGVAPSSCLMG